MARRRFVGSAKLHASALSIAEIRVLMFFENVPSSVELRWRPDDHQAAFTVSS
jgi:hypothetical protein